MLAEFKHIKLEQKEPYHQNPSDFTAKDIRKEINNIGSKTFIRERVSNLSNEFLKIRDILDKVTNGTVWETLHELILKDIQTGCLTLDETEEYIPGPLKDFSKLLNSKESQYYANHPSFPNVNVSNASMSTEPPANALLPEIPPNLSITALGFFPAENSRYLKDNLKLFRL